MMSWGSSRSKISFEQLRACETKQFKNAIDLLQECEERHRRNEKKLSRLTIAASAGGALVGQEAVKEVGEIVGIIEVLFRVMSRSHQ